MALRDLLRKTSTHDVGAGDAALIGLDEDALILPGSWGPSQTYPTPSKYTSEFLPRQTLVRLPQLQCWMQLPSSCQL